MCPQIVLTFGGVFISPAKVCFLGSWAGGAHAHGQGCPCVFSFVLHNRWADSPQTFTVESQCMPAGGINFLACLHLNCESLVFGLMGRGCPSWAPCPCVFCFVLDNPWADSRETFTRDAQYMPADGISFLG
jgi:hypothetical protein